MLLPGHISSLRTYVALESVNWRRKGSIRRWLISGRSSKVPLLVSVHILQSVTNLFFLDGNLDGYQKKKYVLPCMLCVRILKVCPGRYVAKIIFTYILGYKVDVGHMEAVNLISSPKYSEKQIVSD